MATEKRLIDANATCELLRSLGSRDYRRDKGTIMDAMKMISHPEYTPTVDAVEIVHGHWEPRKDVPGFVRCSACHDCNIYDDWPDGNKWNYCPNCGAKMDGDGNG